METEEQIVVSRSALLEQLGGVARAALYTLGGYLVAKGWLDDGLVQALVPVVITAGTLIWQQLRIRSMKRVAVNLADKLPDTEAVAK